MTDQTTPAATDVQKAVARFVQTRGYWKDWTRDQLLARHAAKLIEETAEVAACVWLPLPLRLATRLCGWLARKYFDHHATWRSRPYSHTADVRRQSYEHAVPSLMKELADVQVVLYSAAEALDRLPRFDVRRAALSKAMDDVSRGVRATKGATKPTSPPDY